MSLEQLPDSPSNVGRTVSRLRKLGRRINDKGFDIVNKWLIYPRDARHIKRLVEEYGRPTAGSNSPSVLDIGSGTGGLGKAMQAKGSKRCLCRCRKSTQISWCKICSHHRCNPAV